MSNLKGTNVASPILPFTTEDSYPTHDALYGKGGFRSVETIAERDAIPADRKTVGMLVYVVTDPSGLHTYRCCKKDGVWGWESDTSVVEAGSLEDLIKKYQEKGEPIPEGTMSFVKDEKKTYVYKGPEIGWYCMDVDIDLQGLSVYSGEQVEMLKSKGKLPDDYIELQDDLDGEIKETSNLQVLFSAIRALQAEVAKLKATFNYGIVSCTGNETGGARILDELEDVTEEEPLWAVQESELSELFSLQFTTETELTPRPGCSITPGPGSNYLNINGTADFICSNFEKTDIPNLPDPKLFLYLTTSNKNITLEFTGSKDNQTYSVNLKELLPSINSTYAILMVVSKTIKDKLSETEKAMGREAAEYGKSFVWITAQELINNNDIYDYYISPRTLGTSETPLYLEQNYYLSKISLKDLKVSKFDLYSKFQDFSDEVEAVRATDIDKVVYKAAHITIRSVKDVNQLERLVRKLQENELVYVTQTNSLYIISGGQKQKIGTGGAPSPGPIEEDGMTVQELITNLTEQGLITLTGAKYNEETGDLEAVDNIELSKIASLSLVNEKSGETTTYTVDSNGELVGNIETPENYKFSFIVNGTWKNSEEKPNIPLTDSRVTHVEAAKEDTLTTTQNRGFIARLYGDTTAESTSDVGLKSDRVKIGAFYAPIYGAKIHGCSHAYVELENTAQIDYYLDGCYLHYAGAIIGKNSSGDIIATQATYHIPLAGKLPAGGTYLIRGKEYADPNLPTTYIKVNSYDKEWYVEKSDLLLTPAQRVSVSFTPSSGYNYSENFGSLVGLDTIPSDIQGAADIVYGLALTYGHGKITHTDRLVSADVVDAGTGATTGSLSVVPFLIDSMNFFIGSQINKATWNPLKKKDSLKIIASNAGNCVYKNTFMLDPAKQAFQSYHKKDSSRLRGVTPADQMTVELKNEYIQLPNSNDTCPVSVFTPKASFEGKNVSTDKTQIDTEKPNMVTVSFGINQTTTRCFNWISVGDYNEFVWVREKKSTPDAWARIQSYWSSTSGAPTGTAFARHEFNQEISYGDDKAITIRELVYANSKYKNVFPGCNVGYKSHKCIIDITNASLTTPKTYEYCVGRSNSDGSPMEGHTSDIQTFTLYPASYKPVIYQITDQQGFHWLEYQAWAAAAKVVNDKIKADQAANSQIIPILLNTGDMTQNGTRINEWLDYYNAGRVLFNHLEQQNCVGNNDLGNVDETALGTGDDPGKANPHFYNMCYCYEIPIVETSTDFYTPIFVGSNGPKYIPSMFYNDFGNFRLIVGNTEITTTAGNKLFGADKEDIYTGWTWTDKVEKGDNTSDFSTEYVTPMTATINSKKANHYIYETFWKWMQNGKSSSKKMIFACHEMPFTVVTQDNLLSSKAYSDRSISVVGDSTGLIGSHANRPNFWKTGNKLNSDMKVRNKGTYWLSRLLEFFDIKYCLGGHKHTYACTWPLRESYYYKVTSADTYAINTKSKSVGSIVSSLECGKMTMPESLKDDEVYFLVNGTIPVKAVSGKETLSALDTNYATKFKNLTKFPIVAAKNFVDSTSTIKGNYAGGTSEFINSITKDTESGQTYVVYFMLQATGFKLKSNKELPGTLQKFSQIIPKTGGNSSAGYSPSTNQIYPMFAKIDLVDSKYATGLDIRLMAIKNIVPNSTSAVLNQQTAWKTPCTNTPQIVYFDNTGEDNTNIPYGKPSSSDAYGGACWGTADKILKLHI